MGIALDCWPRVIASLVRCAAGFGLGSAPGFKTALESGTDGSEPLDDPPRSSAGGWVTIGAGGDAGALQALIPAVTTRTASPFSVWANHTGQRRAAWCSQCPGPLRPPPFAGVCPA